MPPEPDLAAEDPITSLVDGLAREGRPSLPWVVRWSSGTREPVAAAWDASRDPWSMALLLKRARRDWLLGPYQLVNASGLRRHGATRPHAAAQQYVVVGDGAAAVLLDRNAAGAAEIRRRVPNPPSLAELLAPTTG